MNYTPPPRPSMACPSYGNLELQEAILDPKPEPKRDLSWILVAINRHGESIILDASDGFWEVDLLPEPYGCDNGLYTPKDLKPGLYKIVNVRIVGDYEGCEISGDWISALDLLAEDAAQFRFYEKNHRDKALNCMTQEQHLDTQRKADVNQARAQKIEEFLAR